MLHKFFEPGDWYAPKVYGYGTGLPIAWQGWALLLVYIGLLAALGGLIALDEELGPAIAFVLFVPATLGFAVIVKRRTRGGWRWRWGEWE